MKAATRRRGAAGLAVLLGLLAPAPAAAQRCRTHCHHNEVRGPDGCCVAAASVPCPTGQSRNAGTQNNCCWAGQVWAEGRCRGVPGECPATHRVDAPNERCELLPCAGGRERAADGSSCCWPGQVAVEGACRGVPASCPPEQRVVPERETCEALAACPAGRQRASDGVTCCLPGQRAEQGRCVGTPSTCGPGEHPSAARQACVPNAVCNGGRVLGADFETCCYTGQGVSAGRCVGVPVQCPGGQHPSRGQQTCVADAICRPGTELQGDGETCCLPGQLGEGGQCAGDRTCPAGLESSGDQCLRVERDAHMHVVGPIVLGVGALMAGGAVAAWLIGDQRTQELSDACQSGCPADWPESADRIRTLDTVTNVLAYAGGATALTGLVLMLTARTHTERRVPVTVMVEPRGLRLGARF